MTSTMERIGESISPVEVLGPVACPTPGCRRKGRSVRLYGLEGVEKCKPCQNEAEARAERERKAQELLLALDRAGARDNAILHTWSFDSFVTGNRKHAAAVAAARRWIEGYRSGLRTNVFVYGPSGGGKTGLAWSAMRELIETDTCMARFASWREALEDLKDSFRSNESTLGTTWLRRVPVLTLDDLGAERPTDFARAELLGLIEHRMMNQRPTWVTSNFTPDELAQRLGHDDPIIGRRIVSRIAGGAQQVHLDAPDRRQVG